MDWPAATPYAIATLAFTQWPAVWWVVVVVAACSLHRGRAALTCGVAMTIFLLLLLDAAVVRPHFDHANYGHVIFAAAILAPLLMLPRMLWPVPGQPPVAEPSAPVRRGVLWLLTLPLLYALAFAIDLGFEWFDPEPTDARLAGYMVYSLLPTVLAARWAARGTWLVASPVLADWPRLRRTLATLAVTGMVIFLYEDRFLPRILSVAGDFAGTASFATDPDEPCATVTAHPAQQVLHLQGPLCHDTLRAFEAAHRAHPEIRRIVLDSGGGRAHAGLQIGRRLEELGFDARVDDQCSSACVTILVGAHRREAGPEAWVGIHRTSADVWAEGNQRLRWPLPASEEVVAFHESRGVSRALRYRADETPPEDIDILSHRDLMAYGIAEPTTDAPWLPTDALFAASAEPDGEPR